MPYDEDDNNLQGLRGFVPWQPRGKSLTLLRDVKLVLAEYALQLPLTLRQIFYRLVAQYGWPKTTDFYGNTLSSKLTRARRAEMTTNDGVLLHEVIRDDSFTESEPDFFSSQRSFWNAVRNAASNFTMDRQNGQARRIILWCEAAGMVPQLSRIAHPYGIPVFSSGKFDTFTPKHNLGKLWAMLQRPVTVIHIGDHDPSGVHIFQSLAEDIITFAEQIAARQRLRLPDIEFSRLAVLPHQVIGVPSAPPKAEDKRRFDRVALRLASGEPTEYLQIAGTETWQAEALPPNELARIVEGAITQRIDRAAYDAVLDEERAAQHLLTQQVDRARA